MTTTSSRYRVDTLDGVGDRDPRRVQAGRKAVETRKYYEGEDVMREQGRKGGEARRGSTTSDDLSSMASNFRTLDTKDRRRVQAGKQAAETRKQREGEDVFRDMGQKGGRARGGTRDEDGSSSKRTRSRDDDTGDQDEEEQDSGYQKRRRSLDQGKDQRRVQAGKRAVETRKTREGEDAMSKQGRKGGQARREQSSRGGEEEEEEEEEQGDQDGQHAARSRAGKKGAAARWGKDYDDDQDEDLDMGQSRGGRKQQTSRDRDRGQDDSELDYPDQLSDEEFEEAVTHGKNPNRVLAGKKTAVTRRAQEGPDVFSRMGKAGAEARRTQTRGQDTSRDDDDQSASEHEEEVHLHRVIGGIKGARTRMEREGPDVFSRMGKAGADARWSHDHRGQGSEDEEQDEDARSEHEQEVHVHRIIGGIKAARTRKMREGPEVFHEMGRMGAAARWGTDSDQQQQARGQRGAARDDDDEGQFGSQHDQEVHRHRVQGGRKAAQTVKREYGDDYYHQIGEMGARARWGR